MRILHVTHAYPRWDGDVAGAFIERLATGVAARGHELTVLAPSEEGRGGAEERHGIAVKRVRYAPARWETLAYSGTMVEGARSPRGMLSAGGMIGALAWAIAREGHRGGAELVHAHWWIPGGISAWLASWAGGPPYVVTLHGTDVALLEGSAPLRTLARRVLRSAAGVTAVSSYLAERAARVAGIDPARITVQPMPVEVERFNRLSSGGGGVATVGRLTAQKRVDVVLDAVAWLAAQGRPLKLTVVGDGPERAALEARAAEAGLGERVRFTGAVPPERIPEVIGDADVFAFAAEREGLGLALGEALMLGVPVAAAESGGVADLVPAQGGGRLVPPGDAAALGAAIGELLDAAPGSRQAAASAGRELMKRLGSDSAAAAFEAVYAAALGREAARA